MGKMPMPLQSRKPNRGGMAFQTMVHGLEVSHSPCEVSLRRRSDAVREGGLCKLSARIHPQRMYDAVSWEIAKKPFGGGA
jgi:hypothetical protein